MTHRAWLKSAADRLRDSGDMDAELDARLILMDVISVDHAHLRLMAALPVPEDALRELESRLNRRIGGEPLQYIEGRAYFMGYPFGADPRALIPRQDTETLCEAALSCLRGIGNPEVLDLCTGSGALAITIKKKCPHARVAASDLSEDALSLARENAEALAADIEFLPGDLLDAAPGRRFDLIVSNPPYLTDADMLRLQREVRHEPAMALLGGGDGLTFYRRIMAALSGALKPRGVAMLEVGLHQAADVMNLAHTALKDAGVYAIRDLNGIERVVVVKRNLA